MNRHNRASLTFNGSVQGYIVEGLLIRSWRRSKSDRSAAESVEIGLEGLEVSLPHTLTRSLALFQRHVAAGESIRREVLRRPMAEHQNSILIVP